MRAIVGRCAVGRAVRALGLLALAGCARSEADARDAALVVFAASSLREVFVSLSEELERAQPGLDVTFHFAGTQELRTQLEHGARADVFAAADPRHMDELARADRVKDPAIFARNEPVIVVAAEGGPAVRSLRDLPAAARIVLGAPAVPIGGYALRIFERARGPYGDDFPARVAAKVVSRELNVRQVLTKVSLGEAQAGIVYRTDARAAQGRVSVVSIPSELNVLAAYSIAIVTASPHASAARAWLRLVRSPRGQSALADAGFIPLPAGAEP